MNETVRKDHAVQVWNVYWKRWSTLTVMASRDLAIHIVNEHREAYAGSRRYRIRRK